MRPLAALVALLVFATTSVAAQDRDRTLADIRQELSVLEVELQRLRRELSTTEGARAPEDNAPLLERLSAIESEVQRLNGETEDLTLRIERIVQDGTNRIDDIRFRLAELEGTDPTEIEDTPPLGGSEGLPGLEGLSGLVEESGSDEDRDEAQMAVSEQSDFDRASAALEEGRYAEAAEQFAAFTETYPGGPLTAEAHFLRGRALAEQGETSRAARAWLDAFSSDPEGERAPEALLRLGRSLETLGQRQEACVMFHELSQRFPDSAFAGEADGAARELDCQ